MVERLGNGLGDSLGLSLTYESQKIINTQTFVISTQDRDVLRELASQVAELASRPLETEKMNLWHAHNALKPVRPLVFCDPENGWYEIIPADQLRCEGNLARVWEFKLCKEIFWGKEMGDDRVVVPCFNVQYVFTQSDRGMREKIIGGGDNGAYGWEPPLRDYAGMDKLHFSQITVDQMKTDQLAALANETFDGLLEVRLEGCWWWSFGMTSDLIYIVGAEKIMTDMYDEPENLHHLMAFLRDENLAKLDFLEKNNLLTLNNRDTYVASGGFGWTDELPQKDFAGHVRPADMWGFSESQETVGVSPEMFEEFVFQYQIPIVEKFGLNCYGCCEPLDSRWHIIKKIPNLRRLSVSNWANEEKMGEMLGRDYIYSRKAPSASLAVSHIDEDAVRNGLRHTVDIARRYGCHLEIIMKDNHTIGKNPRNVIDWCRIAREEAESVKYKEGR